MTVTIPEPVVTIRMPEPGVDVETGESMVDVEMPEPTVRFVRPEPNIRIEQGQPNVEVSSADPQVNIDQTEGADVALEQAEADVDLRQSGDADIEVTQGDPQVEVDPAEEADVEIEQAEAQVDVEQDGQGQRQIDANLANMTPTGLIGLGIMTDGEEMIGEIERVVIDAEDRLAVVVDAGDMVDADEHQVAIMAGQLRVEHGDIYVSDLTRQDIADMPAYEGEAQDLQGGVRLRDQQGSQQN